jgi:hypothetical protein
VVYVITKSMTRKTNYFKIQRRDVSQKVVKEMNKLIMSSFLIPILLLAVPSAFAQSDQQRWNNGYSDGYYWTGSPANACHGHTHSYCNGFNFGYDRGHTSNIYYAPTQQTQGSDVNIKGDNNRVTVNQGQASDSGNGADPGLGSGQSNNPTCTLLCFGANVK